METIMEFMSIYLAITLVWAIICLLWACYCIHTGIQLRRKINSIKDKLNIDLEV